MTGLSSSILMINLPDELRLSDSVQVAMPSGQSIQMQCCRPIFERWIGAPIKFDFRHKPLLNYQGQPLIAELLILRLLEAHGWEGVWVYSYGRKYLRQMPQDSSLAHGRVPVPDNRERLLNRIWGRSGQLSGCFDVYAWRGELKKQLIKLAENDGITIADAETAVIQMRSRQGTTAQVIVNSFAEWYRKLGFVGCSSHSGRRTFITNAARRISSVGGSLRDVQALAGHSTLAATQRYIATDANAQRRVVDLV
jgi:integrase